MMDSPLRSAVILFAFLGGGLTTFAQVQRVPPPRFGNASGQTRYVSRFTTIAAFNFEDAVPGVTDQPGVERVAAGPGLNGSFALSITGSGLTLPVSLVPLQPERIYLVSYRYRIPAGCRDDGATTAIFLSAGEDAIPMGRGPASLPGEMGETNATLRLSPAAPISISIPRGPCDLVIDDLTIQRHDADAFDGSVKLIDSGFPRISKYMITSPVEVAIRTGVPLAEVESTLSRFHMAHGFDADHTIGAGAFVQRIKRSNPDIRMLAYHNSFMADMTPLQNINGSAILPLLYNRGIADEWYMLDPLGNRYNSPDFPYLVQLNHTDGCVAPGGASLIDYTTDYLTKTILPSGLWDGIHFDQPETTPNPLLLPRSVGNEQPPPPLDLNCDGVAEPIDVLYSEWLQGFRHYFSKMGDAFGFQYSMFGNAGYINQQKDVLPYLNGWLAEIISPYDILPNGDWNTNDASSWYRLVNNYLSADSLVRGPQMVSVEFTGEGLGTALNRLTPNGIPDRTPVLEQRDFQRMRLGLTTAMMGNGFFGYDYIDNTTAPVWFDEYSVDANGSPSLALENRGYLGQPLGPPAEVSFKGTPILQIDFESPPPAGFQPGAGFSITTDPNEVISGGSSFLAYRGAGNESGLMFMTDSNRLPLTPGKTYQVVADYKIVKYKGERFLGLLALGVTTPEDGLPAGRVASLYQPDVMGPGQTGTLRASAKLTKSGGFSFGYILDNAVVALDNIRLIEGPGGIWRRDFENGVVLVNPTPEPMTLSFGEVAGPLQRRNLRRIRGQQDSVWNNGQPQNGFLTIPPADGIILLADRVAKPTLAQVQNLQVKKDALSPTGAFATWKLSTDHLAGYRITYGEDFTNLLDEVIAGQQTDRIAVPAPPAGATYVYRIQPFDFNGVPGPLSEVAIYTSTAPSPAVRPDFRLVAENALVAPGAHITIIGSSLASGTQFAPPNQFPTQLGGVQVKINGIPAPVAFVSPLRVDVIVPWEIAGSRCRIRVLRDGVPSQDRAVPCSTASPNFVRPSADDQIDAYRNGERITPAQPARPGDVVVLRAEGLGRTEPPPANGLPSTTNSNVILPVIVRMGSSEIPASSVRLTPGLPATYDVSFTVPDGLTGPQTITLIAGSASSRTAILPVQ